MPGLGPSPRKAGLLPPAAASSVPRYAVARSARHAEVDGYRIILDLCTERYRVLDAVGSRFWCVLTGDADREATVAMLSAEYDVAPERLKADLLAFAQRCIAEHLLEDGDVASRGGSIADPVVAPFVPGRARSGALAAFCNLLGTRRAIARDGFGPTYEHYGRLTVEQRAMPVSAALMAFRRAENFFVARRAPDDCLVRSLALFRFLCGAGIEAEHLIGVRRVPFHAHAWVEVGGTALLDERTDGFTAISRLRGIVRPTSRPA